jgi:polysaccharide biosynthesis/export protein
MRKVRRAAFAALALASVAGCGGTTSKAAREARPYAPREYRIGVEDVLEVMVWKEPDLSRTAPVRPDGKITIPVAGEIEAVGHTAKELEAEITQRLAGRIATPTVSVVIKELNASRVFVLGEVTRPGAYPLRGKMTLLQVLAMAGGLTEFADKELVLLRDEGEKGQIRLTVDYNDAVGGQPINLFPGDTVVVP